MTVFVWSLICPKYEDRIKAMSLPTSVLCSFEQADLLSLVPKD